MWLDDSWQIGDRQTPTVPPVPSPPESLCAGVTVVCADLLFQGDFLEDGEPVKQTRVVANPREFAAFTFGYNHGLFAQRHGTTCSPS